MKAYSNLVDRLFRDVPAPSFRPLLPALAALATVLAGQSALAQQTVFVGNQGPSGVVINLSAIYGGAGASIVAPTPSLQPGLARPQGARQLLIPNLNLKRPSPRLVLRQPGPATQARAPIVAAKPVARSPIPPAPRRAAPSTARTPVPAVSRVPAPPAPPAKPSQAAKKQPAAPKAIAKQVPAKIARLAPPSPPKAAPPKVTAPKAPIQRIAPPKAPAPRASQPKKATTRTLAPPPPPPPPPPAMIPKTHKTAPAGTVSTKPAAKSTAAPTTAPTAAPAAAPAAKPAKPQVKKRRQLASLGPSDDKLLQVRFRAGSSALTRGDEDLLKTMADKVAATEARLQLKAYAEGSGNDTSKARRLSLSRALAVRSFLIENGLRSTRIDVRALGIARDGGAPDRVDILLLER